VIKILICLGMISFPLLAEQGQPAEQTQTIELRFSRNWNQLRMLIELVPEEDSPFHFGVWGIDRGTHLFELNFWGDRKLKHSGNCPCKKILENFADE
jgi:hypothetical protein